MIVTVHGQSVIHLGSKTLLIGANEMPAADFAKELKNLVVKFLVDDMKISYDPKDLEQKDKPADGHLLTLKTKEAADLVSQTIDMSLLSKWKAKETRKPVQKAIDDQIASLGEAAKLRGDDSKEELESSDDDLA